MFGFIGFSEGILIIAIILVIFGAGKLPQMGRALGEGITNFKKATSSDDQDDTHRE